MTETRFLVGRSLTAWSQPDANLQPDGHIEAGTEVVELERLDDWLQVRTQSGDRWWVDGRLLEQESAPNLATAPRLALIGMVAIALMLVVTGAVLLLNQPDNNVVQNASTPTSLSDDASPGTPSSAVPTTEPTVGTANPSPETSSPTTEPAVMTVSSILLGESPEPGHGVRSPRVAALVVGPTGIWAVRPGTGVLYRVDPVSGELSLSVAIHDEGTNGTTYALDAGFGSVWVSRNDRSDLVRVDELSGEIIDRIDVGTGAEDVVATLETVWVITEGFSGVQLVGVDPTTNGVISHHLLADGPSNGVDMISAHGALWVRRSWGGDGWIDRVEPSTGQVTATAEVSCASGLAAQDTAILTVDSCWEGGLNIIRINPVTGTIDQQDEVVSVGPITASGNRGAMVVTIQDAPGLTWWQETLEGGQVFRAFADFERIIDLAIDNETVWLATSGPASLVRLDGLWEEP